MKKGMKIGELCRQCGVTPRTVRYYEECGLLAPLPAKGGQKRYAAETVGLLSGIRVLCELGYSLEEVRKRLRLAQGARTTGKWLTTRLRTALEKEQQALEAKISLLADGRRKVARVLEQTAGCADCGAADCAECGRLATLRRASIITGGHDRKP